MRCCAKSKQSGRQCGQPAVKYKRTCFYHGGNSPRRVPKISLSRLPYFSEFVRSTIGREILFAIEHSEENHLSSLSHQLNTIKAEISVRKDTFALDKSQNTLRDLLNLEKKYFSFRKKYVELYFKPERQIRVESVDWIFSAFRAIVKKSAPDIEPNILEEAASKTLRIQRENFMTMHLGLSYDEFEAELSFLDQACNEAMAQLGSKSNLCSSARQMLDLIEMKFEIYSLNNEAMQVKRALTLSEIKQTYDALDSIINSIDKSEHIRSELRRQLKNIGMGLFTARTSSETESGVVL